MLLVVVNEGSFSDWLSGVAANRQVRRVELLCLVFDALKEYHSSQV